MNIQSWASWPSWPSYLVLLALAAPSNCLPRSDALPIITAVPHRPLRNDTLLQKRFVTTELSTCGYFKGDPDLPRTANTGYNCRVDASNGLWGFCPTSVILASDCGLAGSCYDVHRCVDGCGMTDRTDLTTFSCEKDFCSIAVLTFGVDQTYSYIACGARAVTEHYLATPTVADAGLVTTSTSSETSFASSKQDPSSNTRESFTETQAPPSTFLPDATSSPAPSLSDISSPATTEDQQPSSADNRAGPPIGPIIGGVLGGVALICGTTIAVVFLLRRRSARAATPDNTSPPEPRHCPPTPDWDGQKHRDIASAGWGPRELSTGQQYVGNRAPVEMAA